MNARGNQSKYKAEILPNEHPSKVPGLWPQLHASIQRKLDRGYGRGEGVGYKPWLTVREVASRGKSTRVLGVKTGRVQTVFSGLEEHYLYVLDWAERVVDVREQFPLLPLEDTLTIAKSLGVRHPMNCGTPIVMTLDFLVTERQSDGSRRFLARNIKQEEELSKSRVCEKLTIERLFCEAHGMDWGYVTEKSIPWTLARNVAYIHQHHNLSQRASHINAIAIQQVTQALSDLVTASRKPLNQHTRECDSRLGLKPGTALAIVRHLLATRRWKVDMNHPIHPARPLTLLNTQEDAFAYQHIA